MKLGASLDELWKEDPILGFNVMVPSGDFVQSFARAIAGVTRKHPDPMPWFGSRTFAAVERAGDKRSNPIWQGRRIATQMSLLGRSAAREGDEDAADTGIEFLVFLLMRTDESEDKLAWLQIVFNDESLDVISDCWSIATLNTRRLSHWFSQIFGRVLPANPDRGTSLLIQMMQSESYETSEAAAVFFKSASRRCVLSS